MDSNNSSEVTVHDANPREFTLEDTLGVLMDLKSERDQDLEHIYDVQINNNQFVPLSKTNLLKEHQQYVLSFTNQIVNDKPDDYPIPKTIDMYTRTETELAQEVQEMHERVQIATENLKRKNTDINRLEEKKAGLENMKEACLAANKIVASKTYEQELRITSEIFKEVRHETQMVVAELFPEDDHMRDFLAALCVAYFTSGDDIYVDLVPEFTDVANFLLEADLIVYHRYDKSKVRLVDLYSICVMYFHVTSYLLSFMIHVSIFDLALSLNVFTNTKRKCVRMFDRCNFVSPPESVANKDLATFYGSSTEKMLIRYFLPDPRYICLCTQAKELPPNNVHNFSPEQVSSFHHMKGALSRKTLTPICSQS